MTVAQEGCCLREEVELQQQQQQRRMRYLLLLQCIITLLQRMATSPRPCKQQQQLSPRQPLLRVWGHRCHQQQHHC